jgi:hypothetical protein
VPVSKTGGCEFDSCLACLEIPQKRMINKAAPSIEAAF